MQNGPLVPVADDGSLTQQGGRSMRFRFFSEHAAMVARNAHRRWFRHAFRNKQFRIRERIQAGWWALHGFITSIILFAGPPLFFAVSFLRDSRRNTWEEMPRNQILLFALVALVSCFLSTLLGLFVWKTACRYLQNMKVKEVVFDGDSILMNSRDGGENRYGWQDVVGITWDNLIEFADGRGLWMVPGWSRGAMLVQEARRQLYPATEPTRYFGLMARRLGVYFALAAVFSLGLSCLARTIPPRPDHPEPFRVIAVFLGLVGGCLMVLPKSWVKFDNRPIVPYLKWVRKQKRRAHRQAIRKQLSREFLISPE
jgi:hypothetical protein